MGADNLIHFDKWKSYESILELCPIDVYNRQTKEAIPKKWLNHSRITIHELDLIVISSTKVRSWIKNKQPFRYWLPESVYEYVVSSGLYE